jgi:hypothetical protein
VIKKILSEAESVKRQKVKFQDALAKQRPVKEPSARDIKTQEKLGHQEMTARRHPDATPILSRPRPEVSGQRHIPVLVNARGVPFLRIKKAQPKNLSGVIRSKLNKRWSMIERRDRLEPQVLFGHDEDHWDSLTTGVEEESWADEPKAAAAETQVWIKNNDKENMMLARGMWNVVLAERELAEKERQTEKETQASAKT